MSAGKAPPLRCPYCDQPAVFSASSAHLYRRDYGPVWECPPCGAWVGCHKGGRQPLGRLANASLRAAKIRAHAAFDPLWQAKQRRDGVAKGAARAAGYKWLAAALGIPPAECHMGMMDEAMCARVVEACAAGREAARRRAVEAAQREDRV